MRKKWRIRPLSPIWWVGNFLLIISVIAFLGLLNGLIEQWG